MNKFKLLSIIGISASMGAVISHALHYSRIVLFVASLLIAVCWVAEIINLIEHNNYKKKEKLITCLVSKIPSHGDCLNCQWLYQNPEISYCTFWKKQLNQKGLNPNLIPVKCDLCIKESSKIPIDRI